MKSHIAICAILMLAVFQIGCSKDSEEKKSGEVQTYTDLTDLVDENYIAMDQIEKAQNSDDPSMDIEDHVEVMSKKDKILIVGDSWASFPCVYNSMGKMIRDVDADIVEDNRCLRTTKLGVAGFEWIGSKQDLKVIEFLKTTPRLKYLYLSMGGNDLMAEWNKDFTAEQEQEIYQRINVTVQKIMDRYLAVRPDLKIILSGYDHPNFKPGHPFPLYRKIFERMRQPTPARLNPALAGLARSMMTLADGRNIFYIQHMGIAHYYDGVPEWGLKEEKTLSPDQISTWENPGAMGGDITLPSSKKSMINWLFIIRDAFHLNTRMYRKVMHHTYNNVLSRVIEQDRLASSK